MVATEIDLEIENAGEELTLHGTIYSSVSAATLHVNPRVTGISIRCHFLAGVDTSPATSINHKTLIREGHLSL